MKIVAEAVERVALIAGILTGSGLTLGVAESCTGGLLGHLITEFPGASDFFQGGVVCYGNRVKMRLLGVEKATLIAHGAVSGPVAVEMARGAVKALNCDCAVAISGLAGPGGGSREKPVGTVFLGWARQERVASYSCSFRGTRSEIKIQAAMKALEIIKKEISC